MGKDIRQVAYSFLVALAGKQGYVTFDDIMDCAEKHDLPIQDFDWLSNSITTRGIIVYNEAPSSLSTTDEDEYDDFAQNDYDAVYKRIVELSPSLKPLVETVKNIVPPQRQEIKQLKYQIVDGNMYARSRMIEMYLRVALKIALQRAETYDIDIEDVIGDACIGLIVAVDKYDPDTSGPFSSYASLWILQNTAREQSTRRPLVYYPVHQKDNFFTMYPILKKHGCIDCDNLRQCKKAENIIVNELECSPADAETVISQMIPDTRIEDLIILSENESEKFENDDITLGTLLGSVSSETIISDEDCFQIIQDKICSERIEQVMKSLSEREASILRMRYGFDGPEQTLEQVGNTFNVTRERIRQIEAKALQKLRHPSRSKIIKDYY